jgi:hypothetical protein
VASWGVSREEAGRGEKRGEGDDVGGQGVTGRLLQHEATGDYGWENGLQEVGSTSGSSSSLPKDPYSFMILTNERILSGIPNLALLYSIRISLFHPLSSLLQHSTAQHSTAQKLPTMVDACQALTTVEPLSRPRQ